MQFFHNWTFLVSWSIFLFWICPREFNDISNSLDFLLEQHVVKFSYKFSNRTLIHRPQDSKTTKPKTTNHLVIYENMARSYNQGRHPLVPPYRFYQFRLLSKWLQHWASGRKGSLGVKNQPCKDRSEENGGLRMVRVNLGDKLINYVNWTSDWWSDSRGVGVDDSMSTPKSYWAGRSGSGILASGILFFLKYCK